MTSRAGRRITVDRIVLDGIELTAGQQDVFRARLTAELERRLAIDDALGGLAPARPAAGPIDLPAAPDPADMAAKVAARIAEALKA